MQTSSIQDNLQHINERIAIALKRSKRDTPVRLVAVTKKASAEQVKEAVLNGINIVGESRVKEAAEKFAALESYDALKGIRLEKHMIGHLQSNKVKLAVELFDCIQSIDSLKLAKEVNIAAVGQRKVMDVMIEVNIAGEEQKYGISPMEAEHFYDKLLKLTSLKVVGLMAMAPYVEPEQTRPYFATMRKINDQLKLPYLSMGMSNDFEIAIEEGSNMVRIGTAIFPPE